MNYMRLLENNYFNSIDNDMPTAYINDDLFVNMIESHIDKQNVIDDSIKHIIIDRPELYKELKKYNIPIICIAYTELLKIQFGRYGADINFVIFYDEISYKTDVDLWLSHISNKIENMGFFKDSIIIANPPYTGSHKLQIYPNFYKWAIQSGAEKVCMIFPRGWQDPKSKNGLEVMNTRKIKEDRQIVYIDNIQNVFKNISGAKLINIIYWKKGYNNGLNGEQLIYSDHKIPQIKRLPIEEIKKLPEVIELVEIIKSQSKFNSMESMISRLKPYGLRTDFFKDPKKYGLAAPNETRTNNDDILIYGNHGVRYIDKDYTLPKNGKINNHKNKYKVFYSQGWGGMNGDYIGGTYADIIIGYPNEICTETYIETGKFDNLELARCHAKYLMTKFARCLLMDNKTSHLCCQSAWKSVPIQNYTEDFWKYDDINDIDECLFDKYNLPEHLREFIRKNIQPRTVKNIINYNESWDESHKPQIHATQENQVHINNEPKTPDEPSFW